MSLIFSPSSVTRSFHNRQFPLPDFRLIANFPSEPNSISFHGKTRQALPSIRPIFERKPANTLRFIARECLNSNDVFVEDGTLMYDVGDHQQEEEVEDTAIMVRGRFGDDESTLLDQFERLSFESLLREAIQRTLSLHDQQQPAVPDHDHHFTASSQFPLHVRGSSFNRFLNKLFNPMFMTNRERRRRRSSNSEEDSVSEHQCSWRKKWLFSRSTRF